LVFAGFGQTLTKLLAVVICSTALYTGGVSCSPSSLLGLYCPPPQAPPIPSSPGVPSSPGEGSSI
jgi:hypothetical protein